MLGNELIGLTLTPPEFIARQRSRLRRVSRGRPGRRLLGGGARGTLAGAIALALFALGLVLPSVSLAQSPTGGTISGRVYDAATGEPIEGVTVVLDFPEPPDGSTPAQQVASTGPVGDYEFDEVPTGYYGMSFIKSGYRASVIANFEVKPGQDNVAEFPMPRQETTESGEILELGEYVVEAAVVGDLMNNLELRLESDQMVNLLSAEDLSKFAASDVADALKRVAGVNVVAGQFAIIRGLEDRYSSTLYNGAPIPSPDPDSQSVQLDLFPSDIVGNLNIGKNFTPQSPSNSAGGSINIITHDYPEELTFKFQGGTGFNERTLDEFIRLDKGSPVGVKKDGEDLLESDFSALLGGTREWQGRELRFKLVAANEIDFETRNGSQGISQPIRTEGALRPDGTFAFVRPGGSGGGATGRLDRRGPQFQLLQSTRQEQRTYYGGFGIDLDREGAHRIDGSIFYTKKTDETVQFRDNAVVPDSPQDGSFYDQLDSVSARRPGDFTSRFWADHWIFEWFNPNEQQGGIASGRHAYFSPVYESRTFDRERELSVYQLNGDHDLSDLLEGLEASWAANYASTKQKETTFNARYSFNTVENLVQADDGLTEPSRLPAQPSDFTGRGVYAARSDIVFGANDIDENQYFGRFDLEYEFEPFRNVVATARAGYWFEQANRTVESRFNFLASGNPSRPGVHTRATVSAVTLDTFDASLPGSFYSNGAPPQTEFTVLGDTPQDMGRRIFDGADLGDPSVRPQTSRTKRQISATNLELKLTLFEDVDLVGGLRIEDLRITTVNDPYTGFCGNTEFVNNDCPEGSGPPDVIPNRTLYLDRVDNPGEGAPIPNPRLPPRTYNDQIIGFVPTFDPVTGFVDCNTRACLDGVLRGEIDEFYVLPAVSVAYRPWDDWTLRFAYSQTVARPSFRELGYYTSIESASDDYFVGNPQLGTSDVESFDGRVEWVFGDFGDLVAASVFYKTIKDPIEQVVLIDEGNADCTGVCVYRTYLNNPDEAELMGVELEGRRTLDFIGGRWLAGQTLETISIGGNFTYIDAEVARGPVQRLRSRAFYGIDAADLASGLLEHTELSKKRRLFGQPEWIANADITFDHPDWGTKATLSIFAISEVLDAIGGAELSNTQGGVIGFEFDRYIDKFYQLDLVMSQAFTIPRLPGDFIAKLSIKNLTDSTRKVIYDQAQTIDDVSERSFKIGRDYSFAIGYTFVY